MISEKFDQDLVNLKLHYFYSLWICKDKGKGSQHSVTERRVRRWFWFFAVSLKVTWVINLAVGCHYFPPGLQLPPQPLRGLLPIWLLDDVSITTWLAAAKLGRFVLIASSGHTYSNGAVLLFMLEFSSVCALRREPPPPFLWPNPTQPISWLTQPNPTQPITTNNGAYSLVVTYFLYTGLISNM